MISTQLRLLNILPSTRPHVSRCLPNHNPNKTRSPRTDPAHLLIVLGSGGHTAEMLSMLRRTGLDTRRYKYRTYVVSSGDGFSASKAKEFEAWLEAEQSEIRLSRTLPHTQSPSQAEAQQSNAGTDISGATRRKNRMNRILEGDESASTPSISKSFHKIHTIPRARYVHQSIFTTPFTALYSLLSSISILRSAFPLPSDDNTTTTTTTPPPTLILTNGPGTACTFIFANLLCQFLALTPSSNPLRTRSIFIESFARVTSLSLSGTLLLPCVDRFLVQWVSLADHGDGMLRECGWEEMRAKEKREAEERGIVVSLKKILLRRKEYIGVLVN